jgi:hypothetical protein
MSKRLSRKTRSVTIAAVSVIVALFGVVTSALAGSVGGPFP